MRRFASQNGAPIALAVYPEMFAISYEAGTVLGMTSMAMEAEAVPEQLSKYARAGFETFAMEDYSVHCGPKPSTVASSCRKPSS